MVKMVDFGDDDAFLCPLHHIFVISVDLIVGCQSIMEWFYFKMQSNNDSKLQQFFSILCFHSVENLRNYFYIRSLCHTFCSNQIQLK